MEQLPEANWIEAVLLLFDYRTRYRVEGDSMVPTLAPGDQVSVDETAEISEGNIVVARHPFKKSVTMIKRVREVDANGNYFLISDNWEGSSDSRNFGPVSKEQIKGKVVCLLNL